MGSMSASDAAPLPRLGEVFFDVRGSSRSMRLSWYSDTGVAVFSIWQGGTCTGTFRLPIEDLSRMVEALQRGPRGAGLPGGDSASGTGASGTGTSSRAALGGASVTPFPEYATGQHMAPVTGEFRRPDLGDRDAPAASPAASYPEPAFREAPAGSGSYRPPAAVPSYSPAPPAPSYREREDPLTSPSYRDEARSVSAYSGDRRWGDDPLGSGSYRPPAPPAYSPPPSPSYRDSPVSGGSYRDDPVSSPSYPDESRPPGYRNSADRPYGDDPLGPGSYRQPSFQPREYPAGDPSFPPVYRDGDSAGYPAEEPDGYRGQRYADDPFQSNYPDESRGGSHPYGPPDREPHSHRGRPSRT
jgi:hypothetical protein